MQPLIKHIIYHDPKNIFDKLEPAQWPALLHSAQLRPGNGRYSYLCFDPFDRYAYTLSDSDPTPFQTLSIEHAKYTLQTHPDGPPFQGGWLGYISYEAQHFLEKLPKYDALGEEPVIRFGAYDVVVAYDHLESCCWIISTGLPETDKNHQTKRAEERLQQVLAFVESARQSVDITNPYQTSKKDITSNFTKKSYEVAVQKAKDYIEAGDIFEVNISQRFTAPLTGKVTDLYKNLATRNPAPFSSLLMYPDMSIVSASPERFISINNDIVRTFPIKGTRQRVADHEKDEEIKADLLDSEKDRSENVMIVDLMRNDLSRVCKINTVKVEKLCALVTFETLHHLVSTISAQLDEGVSPFDVLNATFPGGSITGAPKIRAMEIIQEIEPCPRGPYCGIVGYIGFNGITDTSITIRTIVVKNETLSFQVGGAIVWDSVPEEEYEETLVKGKALYETLVGNLS